MAGSWPRLFALMNNKYKGIKKMNNFGIAFSYSRGDSQINSFSFVPTNLICRTNPCHSERSEESLSKWIIDSTEILRRYAPQNDMLFLQSQRNVGTHLLVRPQPNIITYTTDRRRRLSLRDCTLHLIRQTKIISKNKKELSGWKLFFTLKGEWKWKGMIHHNEHCVNHYTQYNIKMLSNNR